MNVPARSACASGWKAIRNSAVAPQASGSRQRHAFPHQRACRLVPSATIPAGPAGSPFLDLLSGRGLRAFSTIGPESARFLPCRAAAGGSDLARPVPGGTGKDPAGETLPVQSGKRVRILSVCAEPCVFAPHVVSLLTFFPSSASVFVDALSIRPAVHPVAHLL